MQGKLGMLRSFCWPRAEPWDGGCRAWQGAHLPHGVGMGHLCLLFAGEAAPEKSWFGLGCICFWEDALNCKSENYKLGLDFKAAQIVCKHIVPKHFVFSHGELIRKLKRGSRIGTARGRSSKGWWIYPDRARPKAGTLVKNQMHAVRTGGAAVGMQNQGDFPKSNLDNVEISLFSLLCLLLLSLPISAVNSKPVRGWWPVLSP